MDTSKVREQAQADRQALEQAQEATEAPIDLEEAVARAVKHNRRYRVKLLESALAEQKLDVSRLEMLPDLTARAGYRERNKVASTTSEAGGSVSDTPTISQERKRTTADLSLNWSVLDFGLSYVRAQKKADQYLVAQEKERKAIQNIIHEVRNKYWDAVSARRLLGQIEPLMERVQQALARSREAEDQQLQEPTEALTYQRRLLQMKRSLQQLKTDLVGSKAELATLIGLQPRADFRLAGASERDYSVPDLDVDLATMERTALLRRPELMESRYKERISRKEVRASLLKMLPDLTFGFGQHYDSNKFLENNNWNEVRAQVSWNLMKVFQGPAGKSAAEAKEKVAQERQMALSMSVLSQVHLANAAFRQAKANFRTAQDAHDVSQRILKETRAQRANDQGDRMRVIQEKLNAVLSELRREIAYAQVQNTFGRIFLSMGLDPVPGDVDANDIDDLAGAIKRRMGQWRASELDLATRPLAKQGLAMRRPGEHRVQFAEDTFGALGGKVAYSASGAGGGDLPGWLSFDPAKRAFSGNPPADAGPVAIRVTARNEAGVRTADAFELQIRDANDAPRVTQPIAEQEAVLPVASEGVFRLAENTFTDPDGDPLRLKAEADDGWLGGGELPGWLTFDAERGAFRGQMPEGISKLALRVTVEDPHGAQVEETFALRATEEAAAQADTPAVDQAADEASQPAPAGQDAKGEATGPSASPAADASETEAPEQADAAPTADEDTSGQPSD